MCGIDIFVHRNDEFILLPKVSNYTNYIDVWKVDINR